MLLSPVHSCFLCVWGSIVKHKWWFEVTFVICSACIISFYGCGPKGVFVLAGFSPSLHMSSHDNQQVDRSFSEALRIITEMEWIVTRPVHFITVQTLMKLIKYVLERRYYITTNCDYFCIINVYIYRTLKLLKWSIFSSFVGHKVSLHLGGGMTPDFWAHECYQGLNWQQVEEDNWPSVTIMITVPRLLTTLK